MDESELPELVVAGKWMCVLSLLIMLREVPGSMDLSRQTIKVPLLNLEHCEERSKPDSCAAS